MILEYGYPPAVRFGGTQGYTIVLTEPTVTNPPLVLQAGYPANANAAGTQGYTLTITNVPTYRYADTELERKRMSVILGSRSFGMELARKKLTMEVER